MAFLNKVVLITGAGSGMGEKTAAQFAKLSARLSLVDKSDHDLKKSAENCEKLSKTKVFKVTADLTKDDEAKRAVDSTVKEYGRLDVVINCAGIAAAGDILDDEVMESYDNVMAVNIRSVIAVIHYAALALVETKGVIVNISSIAAIAPVTTFGYSVSKASLTHFTRCLALELAPKGVRVNSVLPGVVNTNLLTNAGKIQEESDRVMKICEQTAPLKSLPKVEDVADLIAFLASDKAKSMTGGSYVVDSGMRLGNLEKIWKVLRDDL